MWESFPRDTCGQAKFLDLQLMTEILVTPDLFTKIAILPFYQTLALTVASIIKGVILS